MYTIYFTFRCILSKFYIKPQLVLEALLLPPCCILSKFYIKPQLMMPFQNLVYGCILLKFYIKHNVFIPSENGLVVSKGYIKPQPLTINPAFVAFILSKFYIKPQIENGEDTLTALYLIEILHQTTTLDPFFP